MSDQREMYEEINALLGALAKALDIPAEDVARGLEEGSIRLSMGIDERGEKFITALHNGAQVNLYNGAIQYAPEEAETPAPAPAPVASGGGCGGGGCGCGH